MEPAVRPLRERLEAIDFRDPRYPVVSNVTAGPVTTGKEARALLVKQLTAPVRWAASVTTMVAAGVDRFVEVGPGKVLATLNRRNAPSASSSFVGEPADFAALETGGSP
jgi:[acyl-carrier-protein] S-malonyltransferase